MKHRWTNNAKVALALTAVMATASFQVQAAIVCNSTPINFPAGTDLYINLVTGAASSSAPAGWDINFYPSTTGFAVYWGGEGSLGGGVVASAAGNYSVLTSGAQIGPSQLYSLAAVGTALSPFYVPSVTANSYLGVKFVNEAAGNIVNYGWVRFTPTAAASSAPGAGYPAVVNSWCYQNDGTAITAGTTPVDLQSYSVD